MNSSSTISRLISVIACLSVILALTACEGFFVSPQLKTITVTPASPSMVTGAVQQFNAVGTYDDGTTKVLGSCDWTSSNSSILFVNKSGVATAVSAGSATVTATYDVGSGSTTVTVNDSPLVSVLVSPVNPSISLAATASQQFSATATFADGSKRDVTNSVSWSSDDTAIATITASGLATAKAAGSTTIKASSGTMSNSTILFVTK